jgi:hypothetical protein
MFPNSKNSSAMNKFICALLLFMAFGQLFGQNCTNLNFPEAIGNTCDRAPFFCGNYLDNYCGTNAGLTDDAFGLSSGFLRLAPCESDIQLQVSVTNCSGGNAGLIFQLYPEGLCPFDAPFGRYSL